MDETGLWGQCRATRSICTNTWGNGDRAPTRLYKSGRIHGEASSNESVPTKQKYNIRTIISAQYEKICEDNCSCYCQKPRDSHPHIHGNDAHQGIIHLEKYFDSSVKLIFLKCPLMARGIMDLISIIDNKRIIYSKGVP